MVSTASWTFPFSPRPILAATVTFPPMERPMNRLTRRFTRAVLLPTAAISSALSKRPNTARSAEENSCCSMLAAAIGSANCTIFPAGGLCSRSVCCLAKTDSPPYVSQSKRPARMPAAPPARVSSG